MLGSLFPDAEHVFVKDDLASFPARVPSVRELHLSGKRVVVLSLPGGCTWTKNALAAQLAGYRSADADGSLSAAAVDAVLVICVNDGYVLDAWKRASGLAGARAFTFVADPFGTLTAALGLSLEEPDPELGPNRGKRAALFVADGVVRLREVSEAEGDPTGDEDHANSDAPQMLESIRTLGTT
ncbi:hypothetical protein EMIHUDRAFT_249325 [Emiliania huxleyi CCMP1516]|uniref:Redoxin domain-containing protein n=2 Tax=Emiliania huxleyi TaxID=2903 RepID=A0A0D3I9C3_EMIH1|nr:hypothetical protein EMIHUDRAFT_249325 [Emiliania huxleyi CCMP1516]EOD07858.1 hypothetical protein EMIHUDRAFT_249325 [Emiliania huxleyi CCMP1516]|eukprot:XP_005760287.1 hypothetical protein EMIHUDRAFT_249325 [Emiliania huxleyi CCMP1516]